MLKAAREWFGYGSAGYEGAGQGHQHGSDEGGHGHTHGVMDPTIATTTRGIWAIKWSFAVLFVAALVQAAIMAFSGSIALLADTIHNFGDAVTAIPLWVAFMLARRKPSRTFTYGLGRAEDLAGLAIVGLILFSASVAGYQSVQRLLNPEPIGYLGWVAAAGIIGFVANEGVAEFRIRVGREINSAALIADGYHARTDGFTSLAVVLGAFGVWLGFPLADPIIGLLITVAIFGIVWQSGRAVITRMLDGVEPEILAGIDHAAVHVRGVQRVHAVQARWLGHKLHAEMAVQLDKTQSLAQAQAIVATLKAELTEHLPVLAQVSIRIEDAAGEASLAAAAAVPATSPHGHHHAPDPFKVNCALAEGVLKIVDTPQGERMRLTLARHAEGLTARVVIDRPAGPETLALLPDPAAPSHLQSAEAPAEPHEFSARLALQAAGLALDLPFRMTEPEGHHPH